MSLRLTYEPIDSLKSLSESKINVIFWENSINKIKGRNIYIDFIIEKSFKQKTVLKFLEIFNEKRLKGLTDGKYGIYVFERLLRMTLSELKFKHSNIILLDGYSHKLRLALGFRRDLNKDLRELLNYR